ncbi:MAG TPA: class I SAM-dependent methyltransferase, partial [Chitinophagaceae bacterium]|nr:class I SAM-dependent methyltransferase [Chitinophagaceae bacterium]
YAKWRPGYPKEFIEYIVSHVKDHDTAWDCATGNGQAAILLAEHFDKIFATDLSEQQLKYAKQHPKITYSQSPAEHTQFEPNTFDLVTVAQAYHWLDHQKFCEEAKRVCKPGAIVAVWGYNLCTTPDRIVNFLVRQFYTETVGPYWDDARKLVDEEYKTVYFGFNEIPAREQFSIKMHWSIRDLEGYLNSWSSVQNYIRVKGHNPVEAFIDEMYNHWPHQEELLFEFPLFLRLGSV